MDTTNNSSQVAVISLLLVFPERSDTVADKIRSEWFEGDFRRAFDLLIDGGGDASTLIGAGFKSATVTKWLNCECMFSALDNHAKNLENEYLSRQLKQLGQRVLHTDNNDEALALISSFENSLVGVEKNEPVSVMAGCGSLVKELERRYENKGQLLGMPTGLTELDDVTQGLHNGDLVVIAGASSMGKTAFATGLVENAASHGHGALVFSCEMTVDQLLMRTVAAKSRIPMSTVRSANFQGKDWNKLHDAFNSISQLPLWINDAAGVSLEEIERQVARFKRTHGISIVLIDYLQILNYDKNSEQRELDRITTGLKRLAKNQDLCVVLLSQLNRQGQREDRPPSLLDLKGSGSIEANSDVVAFPWRPWATCPQCMNKVETPDHSTKLHQCEAYVIVGKQRQGLRNVSVPVLWNGQITRFENLENIRHQVSA